MVTKPLKKEDVWEIKETVFGNPNLVEKIQPSITKKRLSEAYDWAMKEIGDLSCSNECDEAMRIILQKAFEEALE